MRSQRIQPTYRVAALAVAVIVVMAPASLLAQVARPAAKVAKEIVESIAQRGGTSAAKELTEFGGEAAVREVVEKAAKEGGEPVVRKVVTHASAHGPVALRAIGPAPRAMVSALDEIPEGLVKPALHAAAREPDVVAKLVVRHGSGALETAAKHPGVGTRLVGTLGDDGVRLGRSLDTDHVIALTRHADDLSAVPAASRSQLMAKIGRSPAVVLNYLEAHPKVLLTAAGVATVLALAENENITGVTSVVTGPDGLPVAVERKGVVDKALAAGVTLLERPVLLIGYVVAGALAAYFAVRLWSAWRLQRLRHKLAPVPAPATGDGPPTS